MGDSSEEEHPPLERRSRSPCKKKRGVFASRRLAQDVEGPRHRDVLPNPVSDQEREVFVTTYFEEYPTEGEEYALDDAGFLVTIPPDGNPRRRILCRTCDLPIKSTKRRRLGLVYKDGHASSKAAVQPGLRTGMYARTFSDGTTRKIFAFTMHHLQCIPQHELWAQESSSDEEYPLLESWANRNGGPSVCSPPSGTSVGPSMK